MPSGWRDVWDFDDLDAEAWTPRGVELACDDAAARYWLGPLFNNLGWSRNESGDLAAALAAFEDALAPRAEEEAQPFARELARCAVARALLALGRGRKAVAELERAVRFSRSRE